MSTSTVALPPAAPPAPRRQVFVGTALAAVAGTILIGTMLAVWVVLRQRFLNGGGERFPGDYIITEVATNVMLITIWGLCVMAQWAAYAAKRDERTHTGLALVATFVMALAFVNAQAFTYATMGVVIADPYGALFYAVTGTMLAIVAAGMVFTAVALFRSVAGRLAQTDVLSAHALYWYFAAAAYSAVWFVVYVTK